MVAWTVLNSQPSVSTDEDLLSFHTIDLLLVIYT